MKKLFGILLVLFLLNNHAKAANVNIDALPAAASVGGADLLECEQTGVNRKCTAAQTAAYVYSLMSGDATAVAGGAITFATVNGNVGSFGSATSCTTITVNAKGLITAASAATCTPAIGSVTGLGTGIGAALAINTGSAGAPVLFNGAGGTPSSLTATNISGTAASLTAGNVTTNANLTGMVTSVGNAASLGSFTSANLAAALTDETGSGANVFGTAPTISSLNSTVAMTLAFLTGGGTQCLTVSNTGVVGATACSGGGSMTTLTPGSGLVSGITASCTQTNITVTGTLSNARCINSQVGTTYTVLDTDRSKQITLANVAAIAVTLPQAGAASAFASGWFGTFTNTGTGTVTFTPTTSTINGVATYKLFSGQSITITSDCTNYQIDPGTTGGVAISSQTGANYAFVASDFSKIINLSNAANQIPTIAVASALGANWFVQTCNQGAGTQTITPTTSTIGGAATYVLPAASVANPVCVGIVSDGTNYQVVPDFFRTGANVATAAANALSAAGGLTTTVASGTSALGTGAITSATCATVVTTSATNTATTDVIGWGFNGDPTAVTGYVPLVAGMLTIISYPTSNNVNFKVCNNTSSSVTPGAITLNWRVVR